MVIWYQVSQPNTNNLLKRSIWPIDKTKDYYHSGSEWTRSNSNDYYPGHLFFMGRSLTTLQGFSWCILSPTDSANLAVSFNLYILL